jgi:predicted NAD/FAD-binding protein
MSKQQYIKALNKEIQKLNGIIDHKILHHYDYKREARRHKELLRQIRREERRGSLLSPLRINLFSRT